MRHITIDRPTEREGGREGEGEGEEEGEGGEGRGREEDR